MLIETPVSITDAIKQVNTMKGVVNVIIDLTQVYEDTTPSVIGGNPKCEHRHLDHDRCETCGAWVGHIGCEEESTLFYSHLYRLVHSLKDVENVIVVSKRYYPEDYTLRLFGIEKIKPSFKYCRTYTVYKDVVSVHKKRTHNDILHFIQFSNKMRYQSGNNVVWGGKNIHDFYQHLIIIKGLTVFVNAGYNYTMHGRDTVIFTGSKGVNEDLSKSFSKIM